MAGAVTFDVARYWEARYADGGTSGAGSRGDEAAWKAELVSSVATAHEVTAVLDLGCGDGYVAALMHLPCPYLGYDPAPAAVSRCLLRKNGTGHRFVNRLPSGTFDLVLSLDVIFHLVDDEAYREHLGMLFGRAGRYVLAYGTDREALGAPHWRGRHWTPDVPRGWRLRWRQTGPFKTAWLFER